MFKELWVAVITESEPSLLKDSRALKAIHETALYKTFLFTELTPLQ